MTARRIMASVDTDDGTVYVERAGEVLTIESDRGVGVRLTDSQAKTLALAILTPPEEWRRAMLWAIFDRQLDDIWATDVDDDSKRRGEMVLTLQRLISGMGAFGMIGGGDDVSAIRAYLAAMMGESKWPSELPGLPEHDPEEDPLLPDG